ncbi:MAG: FixH family protein [Rhizobiales bacterium]|nr:FixH family protein [Hyphomicrobiales bacterium]MBN8985526.1 FixH family protein [Hyphomicrobiales bacterium]MBN9002774.1 FixH family protein [Hyphomicrobiales bacterium]
MKLSYVRAFQGALTAIAAIGMTSTAAFADIKDYKFELVDQAIQTGPDKVIAVKLINTRTGKPVPDAVIFATRLDMAPDGMQEMATKIAQMPGGEPGVYRFKANVSMAGRWQLSLGAKVQGETGTVENKLVITAGK